jgi:hypothetical protein
MYWVMTLHDGRGIHLNQYAMPTGGPTSHGCMRLVDSDAKWLYGWTEAWETTADTSGTAFRQGRLSDSSTMVLVLGEAPTDDPLPFRYKQRHPILRRMQLPAQPCDTSPGSPQQDLHSC